MNVAIHVLLSSREGVTTETERISGLAEVGPVGAAVGGMTTGAGESAAAHGMEAVRQTGMAGVARAIDSVGQQSAVFATVRLMAGCALAGQHLGVAGVAKCNRVAGMTFATQSRGRPGQQIGIIAAMRDMTSGAFFIRNRMATRLHDLLMATGAVKCAGIGQFGHVFAVESAVTLDAVAVGDRLMDAGGCKIDVFVAFDANLGQGRAGHHRIVR